MRDLSSSSECLTLGFFFFFVVVVVVVAQSFLLDALARLSVALQRIAARWCCSAACSGCAWSRAHWLVRMLPSVTLSARPVVGASSGCSASAARLSPSTSATCSTSTYVREEGVSAPALLRHARCRRVDHRSLPARLSYPSFLFLSGL